MILSILYWVSILSSLKMVMGAIFVLALIILFVQDKIKIVKNKKWFLVPVISLIGFLFIPTYSECGQIYLASSLTTSEAKSSSPYYDDSTVVVYNYDDSITWDVDVDEPSMPDSL